MATKKKLLQAAAGSAGGGGLNVEEVFSADVYTLPTYTSGNVTASVTNDIDLAGEGGLVWIRSRDYSGDGYFIDSETGTNFPLSTSSTGSVGNLSGSSRSMTFNSDGWTFSGQADTNANYQGDYIAWAMRKAQGFMDIVHYTGNGGTNRQISHNLGTTVGMMIIKATSTSGHWVVYHKDLYINGAYADIIELQTNSAKNMYLQSEFFGGSGDVTSTYFTVNDQSLYQDQRINQSGVEYTAYLFAHNDGDGEFGPDADADIIKCGKYTGNGGSLEVDLGFEAQWVMIKGVSGTRDWHIFDNMRGMPIGYDSYWLEANTTNPEANNNYCSILNTGFQLEQGHPETNSSGVDYIYMAVRRDPMAVPENATDVFDITFTNQDSTSVQTDLDRTDVNWQKSTGGDYWFMQSRLRGSTHYLKLDDGSQEFAYGSARGEFDTAGKVLAYTSNNNYIYSFKRAPNFFDSIVQPIVNNQLQSDGAANNNNCVHNLGVTPEFIVVKDLTRAPADGDYRCYHSALGTSSQVRFNEDGNAISGSWQVNENNFNYYNFSTPTGTAICMLWASLAGVSKVGSYTGTGGYVLNDCGFSNGARLILIKRTDANGDWYLWDAERGITSGNDPYYLINSSNGNVTNTDYIATDSSGFYVSFNAPAALNASGGNYIFLAIA